MALVSRGSRRRQRWMSGNTKKLYARRSLGRRPFARSFAKSLSLPRGSWHEGYSQAGAELPSALDCSSPDPVGVRIEFSLQGGRRWSAEAVCGPCELCPRQGSGKVINRLKSSQSASTFVEPPDQHTLSPQNNREPGLAPLTCLFTRCTCCRKNSSSHTPGSRWWGTGQ